VLTIVLLTIPCAIVLSAVLTAAARALGRWLNAHDSAGVAGQVKAERRRVPNLGGVAIFWTIAGPLSAVLLAVLLGDGGAVLSVLPEGLAAAAATHLPGLADHAMAGLVLVGALAVLHVMGLIDDRRPLPALPKLVVMVGVSVAVVLLTQTRLLTMLDSFPGGVVLSVVLSVAWLVLVTNAMNFLDNMDGLTAGVAAIAGSCFMIAALLPVMGQPQWFVATCLALMVGACVGFLVFNAPMPRASIFMGDSGSLVLGFLLAFLTMRTTYYTGVPADVAGAAAVGGGGGGVGGGGARWYAVLMPMVVLAVPMYDLVMVVWLRLAQGRSPMVGDLQHLSHRLHDRGMSTRRSVLVIWGLTAITALGGVSLARADAFGAAVIGAQTVMTLVVLAAYEWTVDPRFRAVRGEAAREAAAGAGANAETPAENRR
jgi:UDP-GlcNAc:undecaprenyl-phosphate GlcNAc-1-phosphate transferase